MPMGSMYFTNPMTSGSISGYSVGMADDPGPPPRNGKLSIPMPFDDALRAALKVKPPEKAPRKPRGKKRASK